ncbi:MAG: hypothetical protein ACLTDV_10630 [Eubacterium sp.]
MNAQTNENNSGQKIRTVISSSDSREWSCAGIFRELIFAKSRRSVVMYIWEIV